MQKKDLKAGTLLAHCAYRDSRRYPVLLVSANLLKEKVTKHAEQKDTYSLFKAAPGSRPAREWNFTIGYAVVRVNEQLMASGKVSLQEAAQLLEQVDADAVYTHLDTVQQLRLPESSDERLTMTLVNNRDLVGTWEVEGTAQHEREAKTNLYNREGREWEQGRNERLEGAALRLSKLLGETPILARAHYNPSVPNSGQPGRKVSSGSISLTAEQAEKLLSLLPEE